MSPDELAALHPKLYHVTTPGAWPSIARHGLLPARGLVALFEHDPGVLGDRRPGEVRLRHPVHGAAILNDNIPLSLAKLESCLDDGLTALDWLALLNDRVFFWVREDGFRSLLGARANRVRAREVVVFDTLSLVGAHADRVEISPINSGATLRKPARRGLATFTPLASISYAAWRRQRPKSSLDTIKEVVVRGGVPDIARHCLGRLAPDGAVETLPTP